MGYGDALRIRHRLADAVPDHGVVRLIDLHHHRRRLLGSEGRAGHDDAGDADHDAAVDDLVRHPQRARQPGLDRAVAVPDRDAVPDAAPHHAAPGPPVWRIALGVVLTTVTSIVVYAAGKIFRTGLLMQGKAATFGEMWKWVRSS